MRTEQDVDTLNKKLASIGKQAAAGGVLLGGGLAIAGLFKAPLEEAKRFELETQRFRSLGMGDAVKFASGMNTYGTSIRENLTLLRDAQTVFGDMQEAKLVTPLLAKIKFANAVLQMPQSFLSLKRTKERHQVILHRYRPDARTCNFGYEPTYLMY